MQPLSSHKEIKLLSNKAMWLQAFLGTLRAYTTIKIHFELAEILLT